MKTSVRIGDLMSKTQQLFDGLPWEQYLEACRQQPPEELKPYARKIVYGDRCAGCGLYSHGCYFTSSGVAVCSECHALGGSIHTLKPGTILDSKVPPAYGAATFETLKPALKKFLKTWPDGQPFVVIGGIPGSGKTFACWAIEKRMCMQGRRARYENCLALRQRWSMQPHMREKIEEGLKTSRLLLLDGLTDGAATDGWAQTMQGVLDARWEEKRPTLITTMDRPEKIQLDWGAHIKSRLGQYMWIYLPNHDLRAKGADEAAD